MRFMLTFFLLFSLIFNQTIWAGQIRSLDDTVKIFNKIRSTPELYLRRMDERNQKQFLELMREVNTKKLPRFIKIKPNTYQVRVEDAVLILDRENWRQQKIRVNKFLINFSKVKRVEKMISAIDKVIRKTETSFFNFNELIIPEAHAKFSAKTLIIAAVAIGALTLGYALFKDSGKDEEKKKEEKPAPKFHIESMGRSHDDGFFTLGEYKGKLYAGSFGYQKKQMMYTVEPFSPVSPGFTTGESVCDLKEFNGYFYANTENKGRIFRTTDGNKWTQVFDAPANVGCSLTVHNGYLYSTSANYSRPSGYIYRSKDGVRWEKVYSSGNNVEYIREVESYNGKLYAFMVTGKGNTYMFTSNDGKNWKRTKTPARILRARVIGDYMYLSSSAKYSTGSESAVWKFDGMNFTKLYVASGMSHMGNVNGDGKVFVAVTTKKWKGKDGGASLLVSCGNDTSWKEKHVFTEAESWDIAFYNNAVYVATKHNGGGGQIYKVTGICSE